MEWIIRRDGDERQVEKFLWKPTRAYNMHENKWERRWLKKCKLMERWMWSTGWIPYIWLDPPYIVNVKERRLDWVKSR